MDLNVRSTLVLLTTLLVAGCGGDDEPTTTPDGGTDTISESDGSSEADTGGTDTVEPDDTVGDDTVGDDASPDVADGDDVGVEWPACDTSTLAGLAGCVEMERYVADVEAMAVVRPTGSAASLTVRQSIVTRLEELGFDVEIDESIGRGANVIGRLEGESAAGELVVLSAHYDGTPLCEGADDNATGVAGVLEAARVLAMTEHDRTLVVALWDEEEYGQIGSWNWTEEVAVNNAPIVVSLVFEMIGYTDDTPDSQHLPAGFGALFPEVGAAMDANENRGNFLALVANPPSGPFADMMVEAGNELGLLTVPVHVNEAFALAPTTSDLRRSDHEAFWAFEYPAIMVTDTSEFRYPGYHCDDGPDTPDRLDHLFGTRTIASAVVVAATSLQADGPAATLPTLDIRSCDVVTNEGCDEGEKCATLWLDAGWYDISCIPVAEETVAETEVCTRPNGMPGEDNCEVGFFCAFWGLPHSEPQQRQCMPMCTTNEHCDASEACMTFSASMPSNGACLATCDPFDDASCSEGTSCNAERVDADGNIRWICNRTGTQEAGEGCLPSYDDCSAGLSCGYSLEDGISRCGAPCDETHACPDGQTCQVQANTGGDTVGVGVCH